MKLNRLHSITLTSLLALLLFTGCQDETDALPSEGRRTITLDLGIAMTRAAEDDQVVYGEANDLKIWLFDQKGDFLRYIKVDKPQFTGRDLQGNPVERVEEEFDITDVTQLQFRVLLNTEGLTLKDANGSALTLGENTTINEIDAATFQFDTTLPDADNKVPMYGAGEPIDITTSKDYHVEISLIRAVGKLELFFTKESEDGYLAIDKVELAQVPDKGYLKAPETYDLTYKGTATLFNSDEGEIIQSSLPESITTGYFSEHEGDFQRIDLMQDYLLENPNPESEDDKWNDPATGNTDYIYPYDPENPTNVAAQDTRYMMTIHYRTSESETTSKIQIVYLPRIERNVWNKIFARVKDEEAKLELTYEVNPWEREDITVNYEDNLSYRQGQWITEDEEGNKILEILDNQTVHFLNTEATAILEFAIPTPLLAVWRAELRGADRNYFTFVTIDENGDEVPVDGNLSGLASENGTTIDPLQIRIKCTDPDSEDTHSVTLHVFASIAGQDYELNLTDPDKTDQINRFTILQSR